MTRPIEVQVIMWECGRCGYMYYKIESADACCSNQMTSSNGEQSDVDPDITIDANKLSDYFDE